MKEPKFPTDKDIQDVISHLKKIKPEGLQFALKLLSKGANTEMFLADDEYEWAIRLDIYQKQMDAVNKLKTVKARALAILVTDFLNGEEGMKKQLMGL